MKGLVLCSSGSRTAYVAGACFSLIRDLGRHYEAISGLGMASTAAATLVQEGSAHLVEQSFALITQWTTLRPDTPRAMPFGALAAALHADRFSEGPWSRFIDRICVDSIRCSDIYLSVGGWSFSTDEFLEYRRTSPYLVEAILAASGPPMVEFPPIDDAIEHGPLRELLELGCTHVDVVIDRPLGAELFKAAHPEAFEIGHAHAAQRLVDRLCHDIEAFRHCARFRVLRPRDELTIDPLSSDPFVVRRMIKTGQTEALERFRCR